MKLGKPLNVARPRGKDDYGSGEFGASRGDRRHVGLDFAAHFMCPVLAPASGHVHLGYCYSDDLSYRYVKIYPHHDNRMFVRLLYVKPFVKQDQFVVIGQTIGVAQNIALRYGSGMTNHIHVDVALPTGQVLLGKRGEDPGDNVYINPRLVMEVDDG